MSRKRSEKIEEEILELLAGGSLVTEACRETGVSPATLNRWRRSDAVFDDRCWSAEAQGVMIQRATLIEQMRAAIENSDRGASIRIQGLHNLLHEVGRTASKLVSRMNDRAHLRVDSTVTGHFIGWMTGFNTCPECGYEAQPDNIEVTPGRELPQSSPAKDRTYTDPPKRAADPATDDGDENRVRIDG